jgi:Zn-dependent protease
VGRSLVVGRVRGIEIKVHPTFLLVIPWVILNWGYFGGHGPAGVGFGLVLVTLLFAFVLLHELGHSFVALHFGVGVRDITLLPIGGVARIEQLPVEPGREIAIALAGPAVNLVIALLFAPPVALIAIGQGITHPIELLPLLTATSPSGFIIYLFFTNVTLVVFNLLPAFPMDGGRILRAVLSFFTARLTATRLAVGLGQLLGVGLIVLGVASWTPSLVLIAIFVIVAAFAEGTAVRVEDTMRTLRVGQFILWDMGGIGEHHPLTYALRGGPRDIAVVTPEGRVIGMLWRHELMHALNGGANRYRTVRDLMDTDVVVADVDDTVYAVQQRMVTTGRWAMPVTENGVYRGIFTNDRFWHVYRHVSRRPWVEARGRARGWGEAHPGSAQSRQYW